MTAKTSLFNKGIYKSVLRRFLWGSVLYFTALLLTSSIPILMGDYSVSSILGEYLVFPMILATGIPSVVGLMAYRYLHSKKASVFTHSLPVSREANYISTALASLTLMAVPVIANALILMLLSLVCPNAEYGIYECFVWLGNNLFTMFIMFSCTVFVASVTGNSFAMVVLNVLIHTFLLIIAECVRFVAEEFIYGFESKGGILRAIEEGNFPARAFNNAFSEGITALDYIIPLVAAVILYVLALVLYKKRHNETAEDIAGFKCLNHILKHFVTMLVGIVTFSGFTSNSEYEPLMAWTTILILGAVTYFGIEMLLKKSFRVWKSSYKGFIVCAAAFVIFINLLTNTSFFGYETRVPAPEDVVSVSVCAGYDCIENEINTHLTGKYDHYENCGLFFEEKDIIEAVIDYHKERISKRDEDSENKYNAIEIRYKLKDNSTLSRRYHVNDTELFKLMNKLYTNEEYKKGHELFLRDDITIKSAYIYYEEDSGIYPLDEFIECVKTDIESLSYSKIRPGYASLGIEVDCEYKSEDGKTYDIRRWVQINKNFKNTIKWLEENDYEVSFE